MNTSGYNKPTRIAKHHQPFKLMHWNAEVVPTRIHSLNICYRSKTSAVSRRLAYTLLIPLRSEDISVVAAIYQDEVKKASSL